MATRNERIAAILSLAQGSRILHVGCCNDSVPRTHEEEKHWLHSALVSAGHSVLGVDIQAEGLQWMKKAGYEVQYMDAEAIPEDGEVFDVIIAGELIEHLNNPGLFLNGCRARLRPGGQLILTTPNPFAILHWLGYLKNGDRAFNRNHTCWFDQQLLRQLLGRYGFKIVKLMFVDDIRAELASPLYKATAFLWKLLRSTLPTRYRTTIVAVAELAS